MARIHQGWEDYKIEKKTFAPTCKIFSYYIKLKSGLKIAKNTKFGPY